MKTSPAYMEGKYFILPNDVFSLGLSTNAIAVYAYLMRLEDRKTNVCWAKQQTIGNAVSQLYGYIFCMLVSNALTDMPLFGGALYLCGRMILVSGWVFSKNSRKLLPGNARKWVPYQYLCRGQAGK